MRWRKKPPQLNTIIKMKKILFLIAVLFVAVSATAQLATLAIPAGQTYKTYSTTHTITNTTAGYFLYNAIQQVPTTQDYIVRLDSVSGNHTNVAVVLQGQKFPESAWTTIATVNWKGTTADTTILISNATANRYMNYKVTFTGTGSGVTSIKNQKFKLYFE